MATETTNNTELITFSKDFKGFVICEHCPLKDWREEE